MHEKNDSFLTGFSSPIEGGGSHSLYGPPPWHFEGYVASVSLRVDDPRLEELVPAPLRIASEQNVRLTVLDFVCDCGHGETFTQLYPDLAKQSEGVVGIEVEHEGELGYWPPLLWCTSDSEMAIGREMYGWAQRLGSVSLTRKPHKGWQKGDVVTGLVSRGNRAVFEFNIDLVGGPDSSEKSNKPKMMDTHIGNLPVFTQTALADPMQPGVVERRLVVNNIEDVRIGDVWRGSARINVSAPEIDFLNSATVIEGRWHPLSWTKPYPLELVKSTNEPA